MNECVSQMFQQTSVLALDLWEFCFIGINECDDTSVKNLLGNPLQCIRLCAALSREEDDISIEAKDHPCRAFAS